MDENANRESARSSQGTCSEQNGKVHRLGPDRANVLDVLEQSSRVHHFPVEKWIDVEKLAAFRRASKVRLSWVTLFSKAYALASIEVAELRRFYIPFPWPRYFQSRYTVISVAVNRQYQDRERLFFGRLRWPEVRSLLQIQQELDSYTNDPIEQVFRQQLLSSHLPRFIRRFGWWWRTNIQPSERARRLGTGSLSVLAGQGVYNRRHPSPLTSSLSYGPIEDGRMWVTLQCDHRLVDGSAAAQALNRIEYYLHSVITDELEKLSQSNGIVGTDTLAKGPEAA
ncbi:MAG: hypothetical protein AAF483_04945 [Planctomycetota bacterium]